MSDIAVMDNEGNPVILEGICKVSCGQGGAESVLNTFGNSTVFGSQGAATSVCPDSLVEQQYVMSFSQDSNNFPSTQEELNVLTSDPSYCYGSTKCITADSIQECGTSRDISAF